MRFVVRDTLPGVLLGAVLLPAVVVGFLLAVGYQSGSAGTEGGWVLFVLPLSALGAGLVLAVRNGVRVTPVATVAALLYAADIGLFAGDPGFRVITEFTAAGTFVSVIGLLLFGIEFAVRNRRRIRWQLSPVALRRALFVGIAHALILVSVRAVVGFWRQYGLVEFWGYGGRLWEVVFGSGFDLLLLVWTFLGGLLLVAVPTYLLLRSRLVLPIGLVIPFSMYVTVQTVFQELNGLAAKDAWATAGTPLSYYLVLWFVPLAVLVLLGGVEYVLRNWLHLFPPRPLRASRLQAGGEPPRRSL